MRRRRVSFSSDPRWTALKRAGLAVTAALALLVGALWFGDSHHQLSHPPSKPANGAPAQPGTSVPKLDTLEPVLDTTVQTADKPIEILDPVVEETVDTTIPEAAGSETPELSEPPKTAESSEPQKTPKTPPKTPDTPAKPSKALNGSPPPQKVVNASAKPTSPSDGYFVHLGVFNGTDNADRVFDNAVALGLPAQIQSRVVVGPFRNKREAEAARDRLKNIAEGVVLPPQKTAKADENPKAKSRRRAK